MGNEIPQLRTPGVIAAQLQAPLNRVLYALRSRNVRPIGRAGTIRLYDQAAVERVREALAEMDQRKGASNG